MRTQYHGVVKVCGCAFMFVKLCECFMKLWSMKRFIVSRNFQFFNETLHGLTSLFIPFSAYPGADNFTRLFIQPISRGILSLENVKMARGI